MVERPPALSRQLSRNTLAGVLNPLLIRGKLQKKSEWIGRWNVREAAVVAVVADRTIEWRLEWRGGAQPAGADSATQPMSALAKHSPRTRPWIRPERIEQRDVRSGGSHPCRRPSHPQYV